MKVTILAFIVGLIKMKHFLIETESEEGGAMDYELSKGYSKKKTVYLKTLSKKEGGRSTPIQKNEKR